jgi:hypothetical protein
MCEQLGYDFVIRVAQDRRVLTDEEEDEEDPEVQRLKTLARSLPAQGGQALHVPAQRQRPAREAFVQVSWQEVRIQPPKNGAMLSKTEVKAWVVRVWEPAPASWRRGVGMDTAYNGVGAQRRGCVGAGEMVPLALDAGRFSQGSQNWLQDRGPCSTDGRSHVESPGLTSPDGDATALVKANGTDSPRHSCHAKRVSQEVIYVVTQLDKRPGAKLTAKDLWHTIASFGGYLNRKCDGPPGWQTLWKGWLHVQTVLQGVRLAMHFPPQGFV